LSEWKPNYWDFTKIPNVKYSSAQISVRYTTVMSAKAGILAFVLDSRLRGTSGDNGHFVLPGCTKKAPALAHWTRMNDLVGMNVKRFRMTEEIWDRVER
jgi:hypothetical protein